ncbi:MAG: hypothetical protein P8M25_13095 [Paracoccaceae bacterium]|jgi:hypothetical protein|nr:hypothetical protein [Paracoccaceae bacterium]
MSEKKEQKMPSKGQARDDRLKAALKSNLAKRKAQAKARNETKNKNEGQLRWIQSWSVAEVR